MNTPGFHHRPFTPADWTGRIDNEPGFCQRWHQEVRAAGSVITPEAGRGVALIGLASDAGVRRNGGRPGAAAGPRALRKQLSPLTLPGPCVLLDDGDIEPVAGSAGDGLEAAQTAYAARAAALLAAGHRVIGLGGGHEIAYASFMALCQQLMQFTHKSKPVLGILNFDAHFDLRSGPASSGTSFRQAAEECAAHGWGFRYGCLGVSRFSNTPALFERARALGTWWRTDEQMAPLSSVLEELHAFLNGVDHLHLSICLDVLPAAMAPGVSAPAARGVGLEILEPLLDAALASGKLRIADVAELSPELDNDERTARVAARLVARLAGTGTMETAL